MSIAPDQFCFILSIVFLQDLAIRLRRADTSWIARWTPRHVFSRIYFSVRIPCRIDGNAGITDRALYTTGIPFRVLSRNESRLENADVAPGSNDPDENSVTSGSSLSEKAKDPLKEFYNKHRKSLLLS